MDELWDDYLQFLIWRCGLEKEKKLANMLSILHNMVFTCVLERDDNRAADGLDLREEYLVPDDFSIELTDAFYTRDCSVLEMLIGLAMRVDDEFIGDPAEEHPEEFFIEMLENLGLMRIIKGRYSESDVIKIVEKWLNRRFSRDGRGSPFPIKHDHRDQRQLEIWDQMLTYISENYG